MFRLHIIAEVEKLGNMVLKMVNCKSTESLLLLFKDVVTDELDNRLKVRTHANLCNNL